MAIHFSLVPKSTPIEFDNKLRNGILLTPDVEYLTKFANGDLGIAKHLEQMTIAKNISSCKSPRTLQTFTNVSKINLPRPAESYFKNGKIEINPSEIEVSDENSLVGMRSMERTIMQSIFESQKPYMDVIMAMTKSLVKIEDVIARLLAIADESQVPKTNPDALGYQNNFLKSQIGKLNSLKDTDLPTFTNNSDSTPNEVNSNSIQYEVVSTVYSTGEYIPGINYNYQYIDIPANEINSESLSGSEEIDISFDPYESLRPKTVVFGIFDSKGSPIDAPDWLVRSKKWFGAFPYISEVNYIWQRGSKELIRPGIPEEQYSGDDRSGWSKKKYEGGQKDGLDIAIFSPIDKDKYLNYFREYLRDKLDQNPTLSEQLKNEAIEKSMSQVVIQDYLESLNRGGFLSDLRLVSGDVPLTKAPIDNRELSINGKTIWIDPETEYDMKIIKIDSSIDITYLDVVNQPEVSTQIIRFIKNSFSLSFNDNSIFDVKYLNKNGTLELQQSNISEFVLDNWDWDDPDTSPGGPLIQNPSNTYDILVTRSIPHDSYRDGFAWNSNVTAGGSSSVTYYEITKNTQLNKYYYKVYTLGYPQTNSSNAASNGTYDVDGGPEDVTQIYVENGVIKRWYLSGSASIIPPGIWGTSSFKHNWVKATGINITQFDVTGYNLLITSKTGTKIPVNQPAGIVSLLDETKISILDDGEVEYWTVYEGKIDQFLPSSNKRNVLTIGTNKELNPIQIFDLPPNQIRVKSDTSPFGKIIDRGQITNDHLATTNPYSNGFYGSSSDQRKQDIQQIYRYMINELDTETYYVVEGIASEKNTQNGVGGSNSDDTPNDLSNSASVGERYYKKLHALGAIKPFISVLSDIFSKLIPDIKSLLDLIKDPASFLTEILKSKSANNFMFLSKGFYNDFSRLESMNPSERKKFVENSQLKNYVYVKNNGDYKFILDGVGFTKLFDKTFGLELKNLIFSLSLRKDPTSFTDTLNSLLAFPNNSNTSNLGQTLETNNQIKTQSGRETYIDEVDIQYSTGKFIEGVDYQYIYVTEYIERLIKDGDELLLTGDLQNIDRAIGMYEDALKQDLKNKFIQDKLSAIKSTYNSFTQPITDLLLSMTTLPIKLVKSIIEYITNIFSNLKIDNLSSTISDFMKFEWLVKFFTTDNILGLLGVKFDVQKFNGWRNNIDSFPSDHIFDLSEIIDIAFMPKLFKVSKSQFRSILNSPTKMLYSVLCLLEGVINGVIDFIWSLLSLYTIIKPPHVKLCSDTNDNISVDELIGLLSGSNQNATGTSFNFVYDVTLPNGKKLQELDRQELEKWLQENQDLRVIFNF